MGAAWSVLGCRIATADDHAGLQLRMTPRVCLEPPPIPHRKLHRRTESSLSAKAAGFDAQENASSGGIPSMGLDLVVRPRA